MKLTFLNKAKNLHLALGILTLALAGCTADEIAEPSPSPSQSTSSTGTLKEYQLPGYFTVGINLGETSTTRDPWNPSDNKTGSYENGESNEYALAPGNYHYMVLYKSSDANTPIVLPLNIKDPGTPNTNPSNVTVTVKSVITDKDIADDLSTVEKMQNYFKDFDKAYFILNANLKKSNTTVSDANVTITDEDNTASILAKLTETNLLTKTQIKDYSIKVKDDGTLSSDGAEYFTMTTSVYVDSSNKLAYGYQFASDRDNAIYDSESKALSENNPYITGWVERLASKFTVEFLQTTGQDGETIGYSSTDENGMPVYSLMVDGYAGLEIGEQGYTIKTTDTHASITIMGYGLNCLERSSNLLKHLSSTTYYDNWNDVSKHRSYWSEDPHYLINSSTNSSYPVQYRWALEIDTVRSDHAGGHIYRDAKEDNLDFERLYMKRHRDTDTDVLDYFSFSDFDFTGTYNHDAYNTPAIFSRPSVLYSLENTTKQDEGFGVLGKKWNRGAYSATPNLVVVGKLSIDGSKGDLYRGQNNIFYTDRNNLLTAKLDIMKQVILPDGNSGIRVLNVSWLEHNTEEENPKDEKDSDYVTIMSWPNGSTLWILPKPTEGDFTDEYRKDSNNYREIEPTDLWLIPAEIGGGDGQRLIAPKDKDAEYYLAKTDENGKIAFNATTDLKVNQKVSYDLIVSLFHKIIGPIERFEDGYVYYSMPIPHAQTVTDMENSWNNVGYLGVVRNNWYHIKISGINGVGTSIDDPEQPIIPVLQVTRSYLNGAVEIIDWHTTSQKDIDEPKLK